MVEDKLWESLTTGGGTEIGGETERFSDGQVGLDREHRRSRALFFREDLTTALVESGIDASNAAFGTLNFDYEACKGI